MTENLYPNTKDRFVPYAILHKWIGLQWGILSSANVSYAYGYLQVYMWLKIEVFQNNGPHIFSCNLEWTLRYALDNHSMTIAKE